MASSRLLLCSIMIFFAICIVHIDAAISRIPAAVYVRDNGAAHSNDFVVGKLYIRLKCSLRRPHPLQPG